MAKTLENAGSRLLIYYGTPIGANDTWTVPLAAQVFSNYNTIVLGAGLEDPSHPEHMNTLLVIRAVKSLKPDVRFLGYIDLGVTTNNYTIVQMKQKVDNWLDVLDADAIFFDNAGYDFQVTRNRQNQMIQYVHAKGSGSMMNAWDPDDVFDPSLEPTYNPLAEATFLDRRDAYLLESHIVNTEAYTNKTATVFDFKTKTDKALAYRNTHWTKLFSSNLCKYTTHTQEEIFRLFKISEIAAKLFAFDGYGLDAYLYSASGTEVNKVYPHKFDMSYYRYIDKHNPSNAEYYVNGAWDEFKRYDFNVVLHYEDPVWYEELEEFDPTKPKLGTIIAHDPDMPKPNSFYWHPCDGSTIPHGPLKGTDTDDLSGMFLVGAGSEGNSNIDSAAVSAGNVGVSGNALDLRHNHTADPIAVLVPGHNHGPGNLQIDPSGDTQCDVADNSLPATTITDNAVKSTEVVSTSHLNTKIYGYVHPHTHPAGSFSGKVGKTSFPSEDGDNDFLSYPANINIDNSLSNSTSIKPRSKEVRYYVRIM